MFGIIVAGIVAVVVGGGCGVKLHLSVKQPNFTAVDPVDCS